MPYPYILRVWIPITHGYKILPSLAHAHLGYPRVPIPMGKTAISTRFSNTLHWFIVMFVRSFCAHQLFISMSVRGYVCAINFTWFNIVPHSYLPAGHACTHYHIMSSFQAAACRRMFFISMVFCFDFAFSFYFLWKLKHRTLFLKTKPQCLSMICTMSCYFSSRNRSSTLSYQFGVLDSHHPLPFRLLLFSIIWSTPLLPYFTRS